MSKEILIFSVGGHNMNLASRINRLENTVTNLEESNSDAPEVWVWDEEPTRGEMMTHDEFAALDTGEQIRLLLEMNRRKGHWSKHKKL
jgi:hypothetical protein